MRVLVVEDEERLARSIAGGLAAQGIDVDIALDGEAGLARAQTGTYDVITLDVMLPRRNGYDVCRTLRAAGVHTPILMLTAKDGEYDEAEGFEWGADDYLRKPFSALVLTARVHALARRRAPAPTTLTVGDLELDPRGRTCRRAGATIDLTPREFAVLEALARRAGTVVAKADLVALVWGADFAGDPNIAEVYVGYLRRKIDRPYPSDLIHTVRGVGYRLGEG